MNVFRRLICSAVRVFVNRVPVVRNLQMRPVPKSAVERKQTSLPLLRLLEPPKDSIHGRQLLLVFSSVFLRR